MATMTMVRIYLTEADKSAETIVSYLHDEAKMKGVSLFRAVSGFGEGGKFHSAKLVELSLNLPLVIEFFDDDEKVEEAIKYIKKFVKPDHIVQWSIKSVN